MRPGRRDLAARIEPDGGMPGRRFEDRIEASVDALREFLDQGHTSNSGAFRAHVARLAEFLKGALPKLDAKQRVEVEKLIERSYT